MDRNFKEELAKLLEKLSRQKEESLKSLENLKKSLSLKFDVQIDKLYKKRNLKKEVAKNKTELRKQKITVWAKIVKSKLRILLRYLISMPFIYMMIIPSLFLHLLLEIYHHICFRLYKIPLVKAKDYFIFDRKGLPYLNWLERFNCFYCSYVNCLSAYFLEIAGRTERFWCPIKHSKKLANTHLHYSCFVDYSDGKSLREEWPKLRQFSEYRKNGEIKEIGESCFK